jgi:predicted nucleic acid-binding protein
LIIVDSSIWIDYFNGKINSETNLFDSILSKEIILVPDIILCEVLQGFNKDVEYYTAKNLMLKFPFVNILNKYIAIKSVENYRYLRAIGFTIRKTIDCIIATFCIENNIKLLFTDKDFIPFVKFLNLQTV